MSLRDVESRLDTLALMELSQLRVVLERKIQERQKQERADLIEAMNKMARERGFDGLNALVSGSPAVAAPAAKAKRTVAPKYRNPNNSDETWTGRGRKPKWVENEIAGGRSLDSLLISDAA